MVWAALIGSAGEPAIPLQYHADYQVQSSTEFL
uniref:Uncharacterized protein n=1 Tax=Anguilla anguilla TaxID=7936 RepID=A0A0E9RRE8_ANGAN